ncbi:hypothetical protein D0Z07_1752 [Hyphodiscus hymeniophilus]|uniref:Uncharacterized protein n=1 Tax=Hyphodiscus hymeniophilus TaxID=353542 RepID=A0A9P7AZ38_9HELO|nr:hypothetical protein D0Z07_1752 [Hyphodiscus hymeniophilus]
MPSEHAQSPQRPELGGRRSTSSIHSQTDSPSTTPPQPKTKGHKHVVGRPHARIPSNKSLHKLTKVHGNEASHTDLKKLPRNSSVTSLKKNSSHASLKHNRSSADISKRPKSSQGQVKRPTSVHFEIGDRDQDQDDAGWEEASSSASPALSRSLSSHPSSAKQSASNSAPQSPVHSPKATVADGGADRQSVRPSTDDAKIITQRLLQRTPSHNTTKMSLATATPTAAAIRSQSPDSVGKSQNSTTNGTPKIGSKEDMVSRFVGGSGTPSENSPFLANRTEQKHAAEEVKKSKSMGNLSRPEPTQDDDDDAESALAPRSRKSSTTHAYNPPQQSRTQQKLWLQRASSNIEPQQLASGGGMNGLSGLQGGLAGLVGTGFDGRDPRLKIQLERTGLEFLVVRRHQDPVGQALKRLGQLPGAKNRIITAGSSKKSEGGGAGAFGLSQSLRESRKTGKDKGQRSSYDGGSHDDAGLGGRPNASDDDGVGSMLRSIWEKNYDLSTSAD